MSCTVSKYSTYIHFWSDHLAVNLVVLAKAIWGVATISCFVEDRQNIWVPDTYRM